MKRPISPSESLTPSSPDEGIPSPLPKFETANKIKSEPDAHSRKKARGNGGTDNQAKGGKGKNKEPSTPTSSSSKSTSGSPSSGSATSTPDQKFAGQPGWTPAKREALVSKLFMAGLKAYKVQTLAAELNLTVTEVRNATQSGRKGNLRDKMESSARGGA